MSKTNLQDFFEAAGKWSCLAQCYIFAAMRLNNLVPTPKAIFETLYDAWVSEEGIDKEFFVNNPYKLCNIRVIKKDYEALPDDHVYRAVRFDYNGKSHFVLYFGNQLIYNSLGESQCFLKGKPTTIREIRGE